MSKFNIKRWEKESKDKGLYLESRLFIKDIDDYRNDEIKEKIKIKKK